MKRWRPPPDLRATEIEVGGERLIVFSYALTPTGLRDHAALTHAEREVADLAARGYTNAEIAKVRGTAIRTVANQMAAILVKLGLESRHELIAYGAGGGVPSTSGKTESS